MFIFLVSFLDRECVCHVWQVSLTVNSILFCTYCAFFGQTSTSLHMSLIFDILLSWFSRFSFCIILDKKLCRPSFFSWYPWFLWLHVFRQRLYWLCQALEITCELYHSSNSFSCIFLDLEISEDFNVLKIAYFLQAFYSQNMQVLGWFVCLIWDLITSD